MSGEEIAAAERRGAERALREAAADLYDGIGIVSDCTHVRIAHAYSWLLERANALAAEGMP